MRNNLRRSFPIVLFLLMAMLGYALRAKNAPQTPCRPNLEICQPGTQPPPCHSITCPDADPK